MARRAIEDEFTNMPISRQRKHQLRNLRDGKCMLCSSKKVGNTNFCRSHLSGKVTYQRGYNKEIAKRRKKARA